MKFHHIGLAVLSIDSTANLYCNAGYKQSDTIHDPYQHVNICWLVKNGMPLVELLESDGDESPINNLIHGGATLYHTCYVVNNIDDAIKELKKMRYIVVSNSVAAPAINNSRVAFLYNKNSGLIELVESPAKIKI